MDGLSSVKACFIYTIKQTTKHTANVNYNNILMEGECQEKISKKTGRIKHDQFIIHITYFSQDLTNFLLYFELSKPSTNIKIPDKKISPKVNRMP